MSIIEDHADFSVSVNKKIEQANAILFLAGDESSSMTGQYLIVDKGMNL